MSSSGSTAQEKLAAKAEELGKLLRAAKPNKIPVENYEKYFKMLRGIKKFFDGAPWDEIEKEEYMDEVKLARQDESFKEYYKQRLEIERLEGFVK